MSKWGGVDPGMATAKEQVNGAKSNFGGVVAIHNKTASRRLYV